MFPAETRILLVDDMIMMRSLLKGQLRQMGYTNFFEAENGQKALETLEAQRGAGQAIELILADWNMPVFSGIDLLKRVRATPEYRDMPFVLITAEGEVAQVKEAIEFGVSNFIRKPFTPAILKEKLTAVWNKYHAKG